MVHYFPCVLLFATIIRLKSHQSELKEKEKLWKESETSYKKEREALSAIESQLAKLDVSLDIL